MKRTSRLLCILLCAVMTLLTGCESYDNFYNTFFKEEEPEYIQKIRIGVLEPMTGGDSADAQAEISGIELAHELFPQVLGTDVELVYADNQSDVAVCPEAAQSLVDQGVSVILGSCKSTLSLAASDVIAEAEVPAIGITCINPIITETNRYYFRVCNIESFEGDAAARFVYYGKGASEAAVLKQEGDDFAQALVDAFKARMTSCTGREFSVTVVEYPAGTTDFTPYLFDLSTVSSGIVYFPVNAQTAANVIKQARDA
ncbi:MAG: ABC transporter substrate-binding protein, partial [Firmicutes bacterium]|nr:ABC transporter substrate-binding protein [Bacillota bacterium]